MYLNRKAPATARNMATDSPTNMKRRSLLRHASPLKPHIGSANGG